MTHPETKHTVGSAHATVTTPEQPSGAGVLLYPTIMGIDDSMRRFAQDLADQHLTVVTWDPYAGEPTSTDLLEMVERSKSCQDETAVGDLISIVDVMQADLGLTRLGGIGWCFGGRIGLLHAGLDPRIVVTCSYNPTILSPERVEVAGVGTTSKADLPGQTMDENELARRIVGPVQVTRPQHDFTQPSEYESLVGALFGRPDPTIYEYYPGVGHGFSYTPGEANERATDLAWRGTRSLIGTLASSAP